MKGAILAARLLGSHIHMPLLAFGDDKAAR